MPCRIVKTATKTVVRRFFGQFPRSYRYCRKTFFREHGDGAVITGKSIAFVITSIRSFYRVIVTENVIVVADLYHSYRLITTVCFHFSRNSIRTAVQCAYRVFVEYYCERRLFRCNWAKVELWQSARFTTIITRTTRRNRFCRTAWRQYRSVKSNFLRSGRPYTRSNFTVRVTLRPTLRDNERSVRCIDRFPWVFV